MPVEKKIATPLTICWLRRDLRLHDNRALQASISSGNPVLCLFIFDKSILDPLPKNDARVSFIHAELLNIKQQLEKLGSSLLVVHDHVLPAWESICNRFDVKHAVVARDYEPSARKRDQEVYDFLTPKGISFKGVKDQVIFEKNEVLKADGTPYTVFTPYSKKWKELFASQTRLPVPELKSSDLFKCAPLPFPTLRSMGFSGNALPIPSKSVSDALLASYATTRDIPGIAGTSRLSVHLRFGTVSIRQLMDTAMKASGKFTDELIWREFYQMILYHFPHTVDAAFKPAYDRIQWINDEHQFATWCAGRTGYPMVDAGMRELNETGYMHNRVRMVVASFLCKHLLIDWRWGERYFAEKLLDYDQASNVGGWQWAAGCGCDAAPYFRIFNPTSQQEKFDPEAVYIRRWVPEWNTPRYSKPIVNHEMARNRCIVEYKKALQAV